MNTIITTPTQYCMEAIANAVSQGKEIKFTRIKEIKHSLLVEDTIIFIGNLK